MAYKTMTGEIYCPKCSQTFEEGSRRFCPTDGARLVSADREQETGAGGIFADLLPKSAAVGNMDEHLNDSPTFTLIEDEPDLLGVDLFVSGNQPKAIDPEASRPAGRKVNPNEIPAGHVDLSDRDKKGVAVGEFDVEDPERLIH